MADKDRALRNIAKQLRAWASAIEILLPDDEIIVVATKNTQQSQHYRRQLDSLGLNSSKAALRLHLSLDMRIGNYEDDGLNWSQRYKLHRVLYSDPNLWRMRDIWMLPNIGNKTTREILEEFAPKNFSKVI